ncbi:hypothetical protein OG689_24655 [Kitasatospora sp. NBC_00240]|uniref:hypothetical protein n=1 Tax=Kitasatospora sp. NBC_00240 TaxID=2903567 RepID=UPI002256887D|nr:hypothetical protein [Kitasatospora sp. NBC_00240]MCX5212436.1 hypothetical protein [Kitasatospora sp. NBC_00240]
MTTASSAPSAAPSGAADTAATSDTADTADTAAVVDPSGTDSSGTALTPRPLGSDLLLTLLVLPLEALLLAGIGYLAFALAFGAGQSGGGELAVLVLVLGVVLLLTAPILLAVRSGRAGYRVLPVAGLLLPVAALIVLSLR